MPLYRQESTLPEAKPLVKEWEDTLSKFGLADYNLAFQDAQWAPAPQDDRIKDNNWVPGLAEKLDLPDVKAGDNLGFSRVQQRSTTRDVPMWALSDKKIAAFLLHRHPSVRRLGRSVREQEQLNAARCAAARTVASIYLAYRAGWQDYQIAEFLGMTDGGFAARLCHIRAEADEFFARKVAPKDVLVHKCHAVGDPQPKKCNCKLYIDHADAREQVRQGLAEWMLVYPPKGRPYTSHGAIVATRATKTPRSAMIEKAQMERNVGASGDAGHEQAASVEAFKEMLFQSLEKLQVPFRPDGRDGMPVITHWQDQRGL